MKKIFDLKNNENLKIELRSIWEKHCTKKEHSPLSPEEVLSDSILFLSLNPSELYATPGFEPNFWKMNFNTTYKNSSDKPHPHFKKFFELKDLINNETKKDFTYTYLDLLFCQSTRQAEVAKIIDGDFIKKQAKISIEIIKKVEPRLVIVCNTLTDKIIHKFGSDIGFTPQLNNEIYKLSGIPFIIEQSRFMGGQRFLNKEKRKAKYRLLLKEIKRVLAKTED